MGHSQGSTTLFMALAARLEYNDKINLAIHCAPSVYLNESGIPFMDTFARHANFLYVTNINRR